MNDEDKLVYIVCGDIGGTKEVLAVGEEISSRGHNVRYFASAHPQARGQTLLESAGLDYKRRGPAPNDTPDVLVIGTSATAYDGQIAWTIFGRGWGIPVVWVEDMHGTGEREATREVSPDLFCVIDEFAAEICRSVRPDVPVAVCGKPSFGGLGELLGKREEIRGEIRQNLFVPGSHPLVTWWSGGEKVERVREHVRALAEIRDLGERQTLLAVRLHPKLPDEAKSEFHERFIYGKSFLTSSDLTAAQDPDRLTIASDLVISDWGSTQSLTSVLNGNPTAITLFPDDRERRLALGYPGGLTPALRCSGAVGCRSPEELAATLDRFTRSLDEERSRVLEASIPLRSIIRPDAPARIADEVLRLAGR